MAGAAHNFAHGQSGVTVRLDHRVRFLPPQEPFILQPFCCREQFRIDDGSADRSPDLLHRGPGGIKQRLAGILHEMPSICDLHRLGQSLLYREAITASSVPSDDFDLSLLLQPPACCRRFAIRKKPDWSASFKIADYRAISMITSPSPVIDADDFGWRELRSAAAPDRAQ